MSAAITAREHGARVKVLEKRAAPGGNSAIAGGLFAAESPVQKRFLIDARRDDLFKMAMDFAHWDINAGVVRAFIDKSGDTIRWLEEKGLVFRVVPFYPNQNPLVYHRVQQGQSGPVLLKLLLKRCADLGVELLCRTRATGITRDVTGRVTGVTASSDSEEFSIAARGVIIATGGYAGNKELLRKHCSYWTDDMWCMGMPHTGDGLLMAQEIGAQAEGVGTLMLEGPVFQSASNALGAWQRALFHVAQEPLTLWVNTKGERFMDESAIFHHFESVNGVIRQPGKISFCLLDEKVMQEALVNGLLRERNRTGNQIEDMAIGPKEDGLPLDSPVQKELELQASQGRVKVSESWDEIAGWVGADPEVLKATIDEYNSFCDQGWDRIFAKDRTYLRALRTPPYYAMKCGVGFLASLGGIKVNHRMEALDHEDNPIPGLYAIGQDAGGWEPRTYNARLTGTALGFAINSGRIAGECAARFR
ncbi:MAG: FAD-dependent oxidoreductase [Chloroflexi bacterium]|nr:FAD-dependent oxidoreductase [Chloroflexota bacterium]